MMRETTRARLFPIRSAPRYVGNTMGSPVLLSSAREVSSVSNTSPSPMNARSSPPPPGRRRRTPRSGARAAAASRCGAGAGGGTRRAPAWRRTPGEARTPGWSFASCARCGCAEVVTRARLVAVASPDRSAAARGGRRVRARGTLLVISISIVGSASQPSGEPLAPAQRALSGDRGRAVARVPARRTRVSQARVGKPSRFVRARRPDLAVRPVPRKERLVGRARRGQAVQRRERTRGGRTLGGSHVSGSSRG